MTLVEKALADQENNKGSLQFEDLVLQMMDIDIKVATTEDIAARLNSNGWDSQQVSNVWTVSTVHP